MGTWLGGREFEFFEPVFNIADAAISTGVLDLVFFQKKHLHSHQQRRTSREWTNIMRKRLWHVLKNPNL